MEFQRAFSKAPWEPKVGYCRALRAGQHIYVTGTAPVDESGEGVHAPGDGYAQARRCLELIERALKKLGADRTRIVRTRMFVTDISRWQDYGRAGQLRGALERRGGKPVARVPGHAGDERDAERRGRPLPIVRDSGARHET